MRRAALLFHEESTRKIPAPRASRLCRRIDFRTTRGHPYRLANLEIIRIFIDLLELLRLRQLPTLIPARYRTIGAFDCKQYFFLVKCCCTVYNLRIVSILCHQHSINRSRIEFYHSNNILISSSRSNRLFSNILKIRSISRGKSRRRSTTTTTFFFLFRCFE